jgi:hypothetical protein
MRLKGVYMGPIDIAIIVLAVSMVVGVVAYNLWKKKKGKGGCGCGCNGCPSAGSCSAAQSKKSSQSVDDAKKEE